MRDLLQLGCIVDVVVPNEGDRPRILELGASSVTTEIRDLSGVQGVVVATPTSTHGSVIPIALHLGCPIYVEKPLTHSVREAQLIVDLAPDRVFVMDKWRYHPGIIGIRDLLRSGNLGELREITTVRVQNGMPHTDVDCTWILLPHDLAIALEITGEIPQIESAKVQRHHGLIVSADINFAFGTGTTMRSKIGIDALHGERNVTAHGSSGTVTLAGGWEEKLLAHYPGSSTSAQSIPASGELPLLAELRAFVDHAKGGPPPKSSAREGLEMVSVIEHLHKITA